MACACKVNRDIAYLQKTYGVDKDKKKKRSINVRFLLRNVFVAIISVIMSPFMLAAILFSGKRIISAKSLMQKFMHPLKRRENERYS